MKRLLFPVLLVIAAILAVYGEPVAAALSAILSLAIGLVQHFQSEKAAERQESFNDAQARLQFRIGAGNLYTESMEGDLDKHGVVKDVSTRSQKALEIDPNDEFALTAYVLSHAVAISNYQPGQVSPADMRELKFLCRKARKRFANSNAFPQALGILADTEKNHEIARLWYQKAASLSDTDDSSWRRAMATSFAMSGNHEEALLQMEEATKSGQSFWIDYFYIGRALCGIEKHKEAICFLGAT